MRRKELKDNKKSAKEGKKASADKPRKFRGIWTEQELDTLRKLYPSMTNADIAKKLGRPKASVDKKGFDNGLKKDPDHRRKVAISNNKKRRNSWTKEEEATLKKMYQKHTYREMADILKRNPQSIQSKATKLGLWKYQTIRMNESGRK
jgi:ribosomal protein L9